ncbi:glycosyltransferase family 4 protein [Haloarcula marismortui]|uniref:Glycosyltransferase family 4 protein n=1 Tax=Haloarcula marismortui ATCC 33800 TaxID=662476 RepID=M0JY98_9EURY|nr:glycosyltransferase family 4 protein [Haloarcula sinaiiensis]EMA13961.1 hexosyltransferase [Haloarcula sinaiiensis ATCC 33800]QUJ73127.1 glycosyltransferase family 4 protein [Haloarcula sinaiiensis ATCC 33800]
MGETLRICLLSKQFPPGVGGAETYAYELANGLGERGHNVNVYTQWVDTPSEEVDVHENVSVYRICGARRKLVAFETLRFSYIARRAIDFEAYDLIHGTMMPPSPIALLPFNDLEVPLVVTSHGTSVGETKAVALETPADYLLKFFFYPLNVVMDYLVGQQADMVVAISDHAYRELTTTYGLDEDKVAMIPHGVDTEWFYPRDKQHPAVNAEKTTLLYVGRLGARKGLDLALQALANVDNDDVELLIAGTGRHEDSLRELARELDIADRVRFLGYVPEKELPALYSSSDVFILPSKYEGFGLVLLESMACGTPVIGADAGGIPTAIDTGETGLTPDRSVSQFAAAIEQMVQDDRSRTAMAEAGIQATHKSSWETIAGKVEELYQAHLNIDYNIS